MCLVREKGGGCLVREGEEGVWCRRRVGMFGEGGGTEGFGAGGGRWVCLVREEEGVSVERGKRTPLFTCGEGVVPTYMYTL